MTTKGDITEARRTAQGAYDALLLAQRELDERTAEYREAALALSDVEVAYSNEHQDDGANA
jgi:hypothetical protein